MSRIGKAPIKLPENVTFTQEKTRIIVTGPNGKLEMDIPFKGRIEVKDNLITIIPENSNARAFHGLTRSLINNMVIGVSEGFSKNLKIVGVGYKAQVQGKNLVLNVGYSQPVNYRIPDGVSVEVTEQNTIVVKGIDKHLVGQVSAEIRKFRPPEPYKGKGIMYTDERVRKKAGKASVK